VGLGLLSASLLPGPIPVEVCHGVVSPLELPLKISDPILADVVGVRGLRDVLCDRLSGTKSKLRGKRVGYLDAVRVVDAVAVGIPRQSTVSVRGVSHSTSPPRVRYGSIRR